MNPLVSTLPRLQIVYQTLVFLHIDNPIAIFIFFMAFIHLSPPCNPKSHHFAPLGRRIFHPLAPSVIHLRREALQPFVLSFRICDSKYDKMLARTCIFARLRANSNRIGATNANEAFAELSEAEQVNARRILLSDVVVTRPRNVFLGRKWKSHDVGAAGVVLAMHLLSLFAPFQFNWGALSVAVALYAVTGLFGITLSFHRNLSHRSFKLPKWLEYLFAYCGVLSLQGSPIDWVSTHRYHHQFCDSERDPHSPTEGFWFSHLSWMFDSNSISERCGGPNNVGDLQKQPFYNFIHSTYIAHPIALGALLYAFGGFPFLVWGVGVRTVFVYHITWLVNSACHVWGKQAWKTGDLSRNNWWVAMLAFGEGWHNNHHAFEYSARHGLKWWQLDMTWYMADKTWMEGKTINFQVVGLGRSGWGMLLTVLKRLNCLVESNLLDSQTAVKTV